MADRQVNSRVIFLCMKHVAAALLIQMCTLDTIVTKYIFQISVCVTTFRQRMIYCTGVGLFETLLKHLMTDLIKFSGKVHYDTGSNWFDFRGCSRSRSWGYYFRSLIRFWQKAQWSAFTRDLPSRISFIASKCLAVPIELILVDSLKYRKAHSALWHPVYQN